MKHTCYSNINKNENTLFNMWILPLYGTTIKIKIIYTWNKL